MSDSSLQAFFDFRRMVTPLLIKVFFVLGALAVVARGVQFMEEEPGLGLLMMAAGLLIVRIVCEILIIFFRMNETLTDISDQLEENQRSMAHFSAVNQHSSGGEQGE